MTTKNLMLIDDDADDRDIFFSVIESYQGSIQCEVATNGQDALNKLIQLKVLPELIFLDLNMPLMNGRQFLGEIKKLDTLKDIPVVILSTSSDKATIAEMSALGAKNFITKPDRYSDWELTLKTYLESTPLL
jgi:CheY-like chemotaxis protein